MKANWLTTGDVMRDSLSSSVDGGAAPVSEEIETSSTFVSRAFGEAREWPPMVADALAQRATEGEAAEKSGFRIVSNKPS